MSTARLELSGVTQTYPGGVRALQGISLRVEPGELVVVTGPSGIGKTSLLIAAGGMRRPTSGSVHLDGDDVYAAAVPTGRIGFLFQTLELIPYLSALDNVRLGRGRGVDVHRARDLLASLGLEDRASHRPDHLSVGERQRVALARTLVTEPGLILADEPTGNLDPDNGTRVLDAMLAACHAGAAAIIATHDEAVAARADRVVELTPPT